MPVKRKQITEAGLDTLITYYDGDMYPLLKIAYPEYKWRAKDAWKCIGMMVLLGIFITTGCSVLYFRLPGFPHNGLSFFIYTALHYSVALLTVCYFARTETLKTIWQGFGLSQKPGYYLPYGMASLWDCIICHFVFNASIFMVN